MAGSKQVDALVADSKQVDASEVGVNTPYVHQFHPHHEMD